MAWCSECRSEYVTGVTRCPECDVGLVDRLPPEKRKAPRLDRQVSFLEPVRAREDRERFVGVWEGPARLATVVRRRLEAELIPVSTWSSPRDEDDDEDEAEETEPAVDTEPPAANAEPPAVRVEVPLSYLDEARQLVASLRQSDLESAAQDAEIEAADRPEDSLKEMQAEHTARAAFLVPVLVLLLAAAVVLVLLLVR